MRLRRCYRVNRRYTIHRSMPFQKICYRIRYSWMYPERIICRRRIQTSADKRRPHHTKSNWWISTIKWRTNDHPPNRAIPFQIQRPMQQWIQTKCVACNRQRCRAIKRLLRHRDDRSVEIHHNSLTAPLTMTLWWTTYDFRLRLRRNHLKKNLPQRTVQAFRHEHCFVSSHLGKFSICVHADR